MNKAYYIIIVLMAIASCKKSAPGCNSTCPCITSTIGYQQQYGDSDSVYRQVSGKWYLRQEDTYNALYSCNGACYCNSNQYVFTFTADKRLIRSLPSLGFDTVSYNFINLSDTAGVVSTSGTYFIPGDTVVLGFINYSTNYMFLSSQNDYYQPFPYPHYPQYDYTLTRQ
jgi:hypothetical protein